jgi:hypothetical protein
LIDQDIDIGIVEGRKKKSTILYQPLLQMKWWLFVSAKKPHRKKEIITIPEFKHYPLY